MGFLYVIKQIFICQCFVITVIAILDLPLQLEIGFRYGVLFSRLSDGFGQWSVFNSYISFRKCSLYRMCTERQTWIVYVLKQGLCSQVCHHLFPSFSVSMGVWLSVCFCPVLLLFLLQLVVSFCRCWTSQLSHRFKHTSIFEKATHVLGVVDFLVIKTLAIDWKVEVKGWIELTSRQLNEVRPQLGSRMVSKDVTSPSKLKNSFIVMWFFSFVVFIIWPCWNKI